MRSICRMCQAVGIWLEEWCWACREAATRQDLQRAWTRSGSDISPDVRKWSVELFTTIEEFKHSIAELEKLEESD